MANPYEDYIQGQLKDQSIQYGPLYEGTKSLYDYDAQRQFEKLYGENVVTPPNGPVQFSRPGSVMAAFQGRGLSVNDGPAMAAMSEGLRDYQDLLSRNSSRALMDTANIYTTLRGQNFGGASAGLNYEAELARIAAMQAMGEGGGGGGGEAGGGIRVPIAPGPNIPGPSTLDQINAIIKTGGAAVGGIAGVADALKRLGWWPGGGTPSPGVNPEPGRSYTPPTSTYEPPSYDEPYYPSPYEDSGPY